MRQLLDELLSDFLRHFEVSGSGDSIQLVQIVWHDSDIDQPLAESLQGIHMVIDILQLPKHFVLLVGC